MRGAHFIDAVMVQIDAVTLGQEQVGRAFLAERSGVDGVGEAMIPAHRFHFEGRQRGEKPAGIPHLAGAVGLVQYGRVGRLTLRADRRAARTTPCGSCPERARVRVRRSVALFSSLMGPVPRRPFEGFVEKPLSASRGNLTLVAVSGVPTSGCPFLPP